MSFSAFVRRFAERQRGNARDSVEWRDLQPQGADTSVEAFVVWRDRGRSMQEVARLTPR